MNERDKKYGGARRVRLVWVVALFAGVSAHAHPAGDGGQDTPHSHAVGPSRVWRDSVSGESVRGRFLSFRGDVVRIERDNGEVVSFTMNALAAEDQAVAQAEIDRVKAVNRDSAVVAGDRVGATSRPSAAVPFEFFAPGVRTRWDGKYLYVESNGMPAHPMMVGIRAWQQQVPMPQAYAGDNAWRIPLSPVAAAKPLSAKDNFFRGAIALAANGVPIFNPIKNDGRTDTFLAGELDEYGGHCGRADDYHYHIAPLHLQATLGRELPVAYALDGYPIYGLLEGKACAIAGEAGLDAFNGHADGTGEQYHYHASKTYPYINGGMHGEVGVAGGQIDPQPRAEPVRPALPPLRGAKITGFKELAKQRWELGYSVGKDRYTLVYGISANGDATFETTGPKGKTESQTFPRRGGGPPPLPRGEAPGAGGEPPPRAQEARGGRKPWFVVHAPEMDADKDGVLTAREVDDEIDKTFAGYDENRDGKVSAEETRDPVHTALGGFVKEHFKELANGNAATKEEVRRAVMRMFDKQDGNHDGKLDGDELKDRPR